MPAAEPTRRSDGLCAREGCTKPLQRAEKNQVALAAALAQEPFCSARCCREYHGVVLSQPEQDERTNKPGEGSTAWADRSLRRGREAA